KALAALKARAIGIMDSAVKEVSSVATEPAVDALAPVDDDKLPEVVSEGKSKKKAKKEKDSFKMQGRMDEDKEELIQ
ncbi:hypothetical protein U2088_15835, partial [Listeria monocytogenes]|uniref:hypothetical protein n=1 Tax=Listeria monocytogenes TaxID=1639 RepID=UPI002FDC425F